MQTTRWQLDNFQLKINPKQDEYSKQASQDVALNLNGNISNINPYYNNQRSFTVDIADLQTSISDSLLNTSGNYYSSIGKSSSSGYLYALRTSGNVVDKYDYSTFALMSSVNSPSGATVMTHMQSNQMAFVASGNLVITDDFGGQISKYTISGSDTNNIQSIAWDGNNGIYALNPYGKIFYIDSSGNTSLQYTSQDFSANKSGNSSVYTALHQYSGYVGFFSGNTRAYYLDSNYNTVYSLQINPHNKISIAADSSNTNFYLLSNSDIYELIPNLSGLDIATLKSKMKMGVFNLVDDTSRKRVFSPSNMEVKRVRQLSESRYEVTINGVLIT